jgi:hypothetical protein
MRIVGVRIYREAKLLTAKNKCKRKGVTQWETKVGKRIRTKVRNRR